MCLPTIFLGFDGYNKVNEKKRTCANDWVKVFVLIMILLKTWLSNVGHWYFWNIFRSFQVNNERPKWRIFNRIFYVSFKLDFFKFRRYLLNPSKVETSIASLAYI